MLETQYETFTAELMQYCYNELQYRYSNVTMQCKGVHPQYKNTAHTDTYSPMHCTCTVFTEIVFHCVFVFRECLRRQTRGLPWCCPWLCSNAATMEFTPSVTSLQHPRQIFTQGLVFFLWLLDCEWRSAALPRRGLSEACFQGRFGGFRLLLKLWKCI